MTQPFNKACDLCSLPVETPDFSLLTVNGLKQFCCDGCLGIYQMLHEGEIIGDGQSTKSTGEVAE
ncbi:MAG: heavy metal translocating P-type ATPase metal-binding domain-containing protein [Candidatus Methylumidiphilus sp.]